MLYKQKQKTQRTGQQLKLLIDRADYEGNGIARYQDRITFVSGALPGEQVLVKIIEDKPGFLKARTEQVIQPSPLRIEPFCAHIHQCGGCQLQHLSATAQQQIKQQGIDALLRHQLQLAELPWQPLLSGAAQGYRRKARIGVWFDKKTRNVIVGFRQPANKALTPIAACAVLSPVLTPIFAVLKQVVSALPQPGCITHAEVIDAQGQPFVVVRHTAALTEAQRQAFVAAWPEATWLGEASAGELCYWQTDRASPMYTLADQQLSLSFAPDDFIQVNAQINQQMVNQALAWLAPTADETILDLYAGMGNFSLALAQRAKLVHGVEGLTKMVQQAQHNAQVNDLHNVHFWQADLHLPWGNAEWNRPLYDKVVLDPARAGAEGAIAQIVALKPAQILYVSCNAATFARDSKGLLNAGYQLQKIAGMDMFPHTSHFELMALFSRH